MQGAQRCARCMRVRYCSKPCQVADWGAHRVVCGDEEAQRAVHVAHLRAGGKMSTVRKQTLGCQRRCGAEDDITNLIHCDRCRRFLCMACDATHRNCIVAGIENISLDDVAANSELSDAFIEAVDAKLQCKRAILNMIAAPSLSNICDNGCHPSPVIPKWLADLGFSFHTLLSACSQVRPPPGPAAPGPDHPLLPWLKAKLKKLSGRSITPAVRMQMRQLAEPRPLLSRPPPDTLTDADDADGADDATACSDPAIIAFTAWSTLRRLDLFRVRDAADLRLIIALTNHGALCIRAVCGRTRLVADVELALEAVNSLATAILALP